MLILVVGFGGNTDPYTCSFICTTNMVAAKDLDSVLLMIQFHQDLTSDLIDEIFVINNDQIVSHWTNEDGLGE